MKHQNVNLPSGAIIEMRQLTLKEENFLAAAARSRRSSQEQVLVDVVTRCTTGIVDPGPYPDMEPGKVVKWNSMLAGDFLAAMLALRKLSYREGSSYDIDVKCPDRACNNKFGWTVDLDKDLTVKPLPLESAEAFREKRAFSTEIAGHVVHFSLQMVSDTDFQEKLEKRFPGREMACMLRTRIKSVEGVDSKDLMNWLDGEGKGPHPGLTSDEAEDLRAAFVEVDCGVDTEVEVECTRSSCRNLFTVTLPFGGILSPGRAMAKRKAATAEAKDGAAEEAAGELQSED